MAGTKKIKYNRLPEEARPIPDYPTYYATPNGEIWRIADPKITGFGVVKKRIIKLKDRPNNITCPYYQVQPFVNGKKKVTYTHRLVLAAFKGWPPEGYECNHIDGNPANNNVDNLEWITKEENLAIIKRYKGKRGSNKKVSNSKWRNIKPQILKLRLEGTKAKDIALELGIPVGVVYTIK